MPPTDPALSITLERLPTNVLADEWVTLTFWVFRPASRQTPARLRAIDVDTRKAPSLQLDTDLFQHGVEVGPGESCKLTVLFRQPHAGQFNLKDIYLDVAGEMDQHGQPLGTI